VTFLQKILYNPTTINKSKLIKLNQ